MKISIVIPVYKAEQYIIKCYESISSQTYKNYEVIFIDDGSPDNSGQIIDKLSEENDRVFVLHQANGGASSARNSGVKVATGDYLLFIDSDDFLRYNDSLERIVSYAMSLNYPDIVGFNISYYYPSTKSYRDWIGYSDAVTKATCKDVLIQELVRHGTLPVTPCGKLIKRDIYLNVGIKFIEGTIAEDIPWTIQLFDKLSSICYMNEYHYCYRQEVSTSVTGSFSDTKYMQLLSVIESLIPLISNTNFSERTKEFLFSFAAYELSIAMSNVHRLDKILKANSRIKLRQLCWLLQYTHNPKVRMVSFVYNIFGYTVTEFVLRIYNRYRSRKK